MRDLLGLATRSGYPEPIGLDSGRDEPADGAEPPNACRACSTLRASIHRFCDQKIGWSRIGFALSIDHHRDRGCSCSINILRDIDYQGGAAGAGHRPIRATSCSPRCSSPAAISRSRSTICSRCARSAGPTCRTAIAALGRLHQLFGRPQCRRQRLHRRRGALPHLLGLGAQRHRGREALLHRRPDVLARQCHRARSRHRLCAGGRQRHQSVAALAQSRCSRSSRSWCWRSMSPGSGPGSASSAATAGRSRCRAGR